MTHGGAGEGGRGQFKPPDHSLGDERTIGGYAAVHARPAAFEGADGFSYSVELLTAETGDVHTPWGGFILFIRWARIGAQSPEGHLETEFLVSAGDESSARAALGALPLEDVKAALDGLVASRMQERAGGGRAWWDVMRDEDGSSNGVA